MNDETTMNSNISLVDQMNSDKGFIQKRRLLTFTSLILIVLSLTGATVDSANTFILKISFSNQHAIGQLLVVATFFLMIRYYSFTLPYHKALYDQWSLEMLKDWYFIHYSAEGDYPPFPTILGKLPTILKGYANLNEIVGEEPIKWHAEYICKPPMRRYIKIYLYDQYRDYDPIINIYSQSPRVYFNSLMYELRYQLKSLLTRREYLDTLSAYLFGVFALCSYFFNNSIIKFLNIFLSNG